MTNQQSQTPSVAAVASSDWLNESASQSLVPEGATNESMAAILGGL